MSKRLAVLWVWSDPTCLTGAFGEARRWSIKMFGRAAVGSYQGLTGALVAWPDKVVGRPSYPAVSTSLGHRVAVSRVEANIRPP